MCYMVSGKFYYISSICPVLCPAPSIGSKFLLFHLDFQRKRHLLKTLLAALQPNCFHRAPGSPVKKLFPAEVTLCASSECPDDCFSLQKLFCDQKSQVVKRQHFKGQKFWSQKGKESLSWELKGEVFCLSLRVWEQIWLLCIKRARR